ncbi:MaoC family dehydratase [Candidatus Mycobacterium methanotrophicum]|uniref:MaoC family dehydratase n=1 Tax=Candidatus Mycobacterium methanotrophicum TaxID=2943498 RepID=A0ABY4QKT5_9MYCO|nr:MaoC family dehydratase [Candidatus Mycobacterium methanotrophicum]UQX10852.1 MaoC family dehydratase [Candidatus Mycobacterium methanotrophicum]
MTGGPYFDELQSGQVFAGAPSMTLTHGMAAVHQSILGDRLRLPLDAELSAAVTGSAGQIAHPGLVCDVAIGQSTPVTAHVKANLFYRGLVFYRFPAIGDTLFTRTEVVGLKKNSAKPDRAPTGLVALRMTTIDQVDRLILDFYRCAMLPLSPDAGPNAADHADDLSKVGADLAPPPSAVDEWDGEVFRERIPGPHFDADLAGTALRGSADVVTGASELARLTLNIASVHHDSRISGRRLVYGGHTIGLALAQASRLLPNLATVLGWQSCDHTAPVYEGDTLCSELHVDSAEPTDNGGVLGLRSLVYAVSDSGDAPRQVLDWRFTALQF